MPVHAASRPTDVLGPASFIHQLLSVPGAGYFSVSTPMLTNLALTQVTRFQRASLHLRHAATQLQLSAPGLWVLLAQSLCISHLLTGCVVWCPTLPVQFTLRPPCGSPIS